MSLPTYTDMINSSIRIRRECISFNKDFFCRFMSNEEYVRRKQKILNQVNEYNVLAKQLKTTPFRIYNGMEKIDESFILQE